MGWNMAGSGNRGSGRAEFEYVIVSTTVLGPAADDGAKFTGKITVSDRTQGGRITRDVHIDSATLTELREQSMQEGARANIAAGNAYREKVWGRRDRSTGGDDLSSKGGASHGFSDPTGMGGE